MRARLHFTAAMALLLTIVMVACLGSARIARADLGDCAQPMTDNPDKPLATDCLRILQRAVGLRNCAEFDDCVCDPDGDGEVDATDALLCLRIAVGRPGSLQCDCVVTTTTTTIPEPPGCRGPGPLQDLQLDCRNRIHRYSMTVGGFTETTELTTNGSRVRIIATLERASRKQKRPRGGQSTTTTSSTTSSTLPTALDGSLFGEVQSSTTFEVDEVCLHVDECGTRSRKRPRGSQCASVEEYDFRGSLLNNGQSLRIVVGEFPGFPGGTFVYSYRGSEPAECPYDGN